MQLKPQLWKQPLSSHLSPQVSGAAEQLYYSSVLRPSLHVWRSGLRDYSSWVLLSIQDTPIPQGWGFYNLGEGVMWAAPITLCRGISYSHPGRPADAAAITSLGLPLVPPSSVEGGGVTGPASARWVTLNSTNGKGASDPTTEASNDIGKDKDKASMQPPFLLGDVIASVPVKVAEKIQLLDFVDMVDLQDNLEVQRRRSWSRDEPDRAPPPKQNVHVWSEIP